MEASPARSLLYDGSRADERAVVVTNLLAH